MRTSDPATTVKENSGPVLTRFSLDQSGNEADFLFDAALSTALGASREHQAGVPRPQGPLAPDVVDKTHRYWQAAKCLCIGPIYHLERLFLGWPLKTRDDIRQHLEDMPAIRKLRWSADLSEPDGLPPMAESQLRPSLFGDS